MANEPDPQDILLVCNIDVGCEEYDTDYGHSHSEFFQVNYGGRPFRITPGQTRRMPRYLADHFAKHLANHVLMRQEQETGRRGMMQSPIERPRTLGRILVGVDEWYNEAPSLDDGARAEKQVDTLNRIEDTERVMDLGEMPNQTLGVLKQEGPPLDEIIKNAGLASKDSDAPVDMPPEDKTTSLFDKDKPLPNKEALLKACYDQNIEVTGKESQEQLASKLRSF